ncbi:MAG: hypothetical protein MUE42_06315 [Opitutaceae bacterium]|jgi:hypothetical protein|nr:hypothetical protein [Opitutaceae bacterium]
MKTIVAARALPAGRLLSIAVCGLAILAGGSAARAFPVASQATGNFPSYDGSNYVLGLEDHSVTPPAIRARLLDGTGATAGPLIDLGGRGIAVNTAFDGERHLVVWEDALTGGDLSGWSVRGRFLTMQGATSGPELVITPGQSMADGAHYLAYGGGVYLVAYTRFIDSGQPDPNHSGNRCVAARLVARDGTVGPDLRLSAGAGAQPSVAFDGERFLVAWCEDVGDSEVRGCFVAPDGTVGAEFGINASPAPSDNPIAIAFDEKHHLVAWSDETSGYETMTWDVFAQRVDTEGRLVGPVITVANEAAPEIVTSVSFDGRHFLAAWVRLESETESDVLARFIDRAGVAVVPAFAVDATPGPHFGGVAFAMGAHLALVTNGQIGEGGFTAVNGVSGSFIAPIGARPREDWAATAFGAQAGDPLWRGRRRIRTGTACPTCSNTRSAVIRSRPRPARRLRPGWRRAGSGSCFAGRRARSCSTKCRRAMIC